MTERKTVIICGTIVLLTCICATVYLSTTSNNDATAVGLIGAIVMSVLGATYGIVRTDRTEQKVEAVGQLAQQALEQGGVGGNTSARLEKIERVLAALAERER